MSDTPIAIGSAGPLDLHHSTVESSRSAVSWPAIIAGAVVATASSLILLALGSGLGFAAGSALTPGGALAGFAVMTGIWLILTQWIASGVGGYLTGRLRTRWTDTHTHEVFFRDTAHGFLAWALSTLLVAALAVTTGLAGGHAAQTAASADDSNFQVDLLFRSARPDDSASAPAAHSEAARILAREATNTAVATDRDYLVQMVASRTGITAADAAARVDTTIVNVRQAADTARKAASATGIFTALALLIGAFIACVAATLGGQQRDEHP